MKRSLLIAALAALALVSCGPKVKLVPSENFKKNVNGVDVNLYTISGGGITAQITNYGGRVVSLFVPDRNGNLADVCVGLKTLDQYQFNKGERFLGAIVGPVANRISGASFTLDGKTYELFANDGPNTLHGGLRGVDLVPWEVREVTANSVRMALVLRDGYEGFPGNRRLMATYTCTDDGALKVDFLAATDKATPICLASHAFFNLSGSGDILDHELQINASVYTPVDSLLIPTGEFASVEGTPFDFREPHKIGERIGEDNEQLALAHGYDHNWAVDSKYSKDLDLMATLYDPKSGRVMEVLSDQPGLQFYSGNFFDGTALDKNGKAMEFRSALALETQTFPNAVNQHGFQDIILSAGNYYNHSVMYRFSVK